MRLQAFHVQLVRQLAEQHVSQRGISQRVGISRDSVRRILQGKVDLARPRPRNIPFPLPNDRSPPRRCPQCGGLVHMPCLACSVRRFVNVQRAGTTRPSMEKATAVGPIGEFTYSC